MLKWRLLVLLTYCTTLCTAQTNALRESKSIKPRYEFIPNQGQWHPMALYKTTVPYGNLYLESTGLMYELTDSADYNQLQNHKHDHSRQGLNTPVKKTALRLQFEGAHFAPRTYGKGKQEHYFNYFFGTDRDRWATHVHPFSEVVYPEIYPGVDFEISGQDAIKYQWVIKKPTTDNINKIKIQVNGASSIEIVEKKLVIKTSCGDLVDDVPFAYQIIDNEIIAIEASYRLSGTVVTYAIEGKINESHPLIIDPKLIFSTYS
ncbi:MAG: hypothetical protein ACPGTP_03195, partial [Bacteroidia bacterium]